MPTGSIETDPFGTAGLRDRVLAAWIEAPERFREDANLAEDLVLAYRDRVVVELAQNAADAAVRAGVGGRLLLRVTATELRASNVGEPLDAAGVVGLASLRASAKRQTGPAETTGPTGTVGRFGVGFAAVLAVSDAPRMLSQTGAVAFDRVRTEQEVTAVAARAAAAGRPGLAAELARRTGAAQHLAATGVLPILRLPWPAAQAPDPGWETTVVLPLRDARAAAEVRRQVEEVGPGLLLALPALREITVDVDGVVRAVHASADGPFVTVVDDGQVTRWRVVTRATPARQEWLADRPVEERSRAVISVTWALPVDEADQPGPWPAGLPRVACAPTPSDEPVTLPALLVADLPMDPTRRHVAPGRLTEAVITMAAQAYGELVTAVPHPSLVPRGLPAGELDGALQAEVGVQLRRTPFLPGHRCPSDFVVAEGLDDATLAVLGDLAPPALPELWARDPAAVDLLGIGSLPLADLVDSLATVSRPGRWWRDLYAAMEASLTSGGYRGRLGGESDRLADLGALPVPLADGRLVRGPRGLLVPGADMPDLPGVLRRVRLRLVDPEAAHPLLARLGAREASPAALLDDPALADAVEHAEPGPAELAEAGPAEHAEAGPAEHAEAGPAELAEAVLALVAAAGADAVGRPWLARLLVPDDEGGLGEPAELCLPGAVVRTLARPDAYGTVDPDFVARVGTAPLLAVGVRDGYPVVRLADWAPGLAEDTVDDDTLDELEDWLRSVAAELDVPAATLSVPEHDLVVDLDLVDDARPDVWVQVLGALAVDPRARAALVAPARLLAAGRVRAARSYTSWWFRQHAHLRGLSFTAYRVPAASPGSRGRPAQDALMCALYHDWPEDAPAVDPAVLPAVGVRADLAGLLAEPGGPDELLTRLADPALTLEPALLARAYAALGQVEPDAITPPDRLRAIVGDGTAVVDASDVVVVDRPDLLPVVVGTRRAHLRVPLAVASAVADALDVGRASDVYDVGVPPGGELRALPVLAGGAGDKRSWVLGDTAAAVPSTWWEHERLDIHGTDVDWLVVDGQVHATTMVGLARGLAWACGRWEARYLFTELLTDPTSAPLTLAESQLDQLPDG